MVEIIRRNRKTPILTPSSIPCLKHLPTINITEGCSLGCTYCYIQGYSHYPGANKIVLYANAAELVRDELRRKRRLPTRVYFSPSSDAFQPLSEVQDVTYQTMSVLLQAGIEVSFLTKGFVTHRFLQLFADQPQLVFAQIGITTLDDRLRQTFEPYTASPLERLKCIESLRRIGVETTARLDPLIPDVSDTEDNLRPLFESLQEMGITGAAASYLFIRPAFQRTVMMQLEGTAACQSSASWRYQPFMRGCGGGKTLELGERKSRFDRVVALARILHESCDGAVASACVVVWLKVERRRA